MPQTLVAFSESIDPGGVYANLAAVPDQHVRTAGDRITIGDYNQLVGAYAANGTGAAEARLESPSLRRVSNYYITPVEGAITPSADPLMMYRPDSPVALDKHEDLEARTNCNPAAAEQLAILAWLADGPITPVDGPIITINFTVNTALVVNSWENSEITLADTLPIGDYAVVGARVVGANIIGFRFVPIGGTNRPGGVGASAVNAKDPYNQRFGRMGEWFRFNTTALPSVDLLGAAAAVAADYECYMDIIKL